MDRKKTQVLQWARRVRDFLVEHNIKSDLAELATLVQELDDAIGQLTANGAAQEAITKQSRVQTTEIQRLRKTLRDNHLKPIVRMSRTMKLESNGDPITFVLPHFNVDSERLALHGDATVTALKTFGPEFVARGFASNFVEQLSNTTKALREAIDQRSAQLSRRIQATAAAEQDATVVIKLVRVIDTLVRTVLETDPVLLAGWENVVALPQPPRPGDVVVAKPVVSVVATPTSATTASSGTGAPQAAA